MMLMQMMRHRVIDAADGRVPAAGARQRVTRRQRTRARAGPMRRADDASKTGTRRPTNAEIQRWAAREIRLQVEFGAGGGVVMVVVGGVRQLGVMRAGRVRLMVLVDRMRRRQRWLMMCRRRRHLLLVRWRQRRLIVRMMLLLLLGSEFVEQRRTGRSAGSITGVATVTGSMPFGAFGALRGSSTTIIAAAAAAASAAALGLCGVAVLLVATRRTPAVAQRGRAPISPGHFILYPITRRI